MNPRYVPGNPFAVCDCLDQPYAAAHKARRRFSRGIVVLFGACVLPVLVLAAGKSLNAQSVCPVSDKENPPSNNGALNVPNFVTYRPLVAGDYVVIEYDAGQDQSDPFRNKASWTDYTRKFDFKGLNNRSQIIDQNGSFLPVIYTKEKIAVRVCKLHFTDVLTVTTSPNQVPEGGADIRGATPVPPPTTSLSATLDMLQSGTTTGGTTSQPGLGLGAPGQLPPLSVPGITPGTETEDETPGKFPTYTPAAVTASGKQVALLLYSVARNAMELSRLIDRTLGTPYPESSQTLRSYQSQPPPPDDSEASGSDHSETREEFKIAPGSVLGVDSILNRVLKNVRSDDKDPAASAAFDRDMTDIQNVNAQISTLASALSSQEFASNAITLLNNFSTLTGVLDLAMLVEKPDYCSHLQPSVQPGPMSDDVLKNLDFKTIGKLTVAQVLSLDGKQIGLIPKDTKDSGGKTVQQRVRSLQAALKVLGLETPSRASDKPVCSAFEKQKVKDFWKGYNHQVSYLMDQDNPKEQKCLGVRDTDPEVNKIDEEDFGGYVGCTLNVLNGNLDTLRNGLKDIDKKTTELYDRMNEWYFGSSVEQTDLLAPLTANAFVRISIIVQRGYTPFTLVNAVSSITPTATANVPATTGTASTSTPAHAVKTILVEVHRMANFNLVGGVMLIHVPTASFAVQASPTPATANTSGSTTTYSGTCGGEPVAAPPPTTPPSPGQSVNYSCIVQTQQTQWQVAGMAGLVWFPWGHDYFPRHGGYANFGRNLAPSLILATSVTSLGNSMGGVNWEPVSGLDFYAGIGSAHRTVLPAGLAVNAAVASGTTINQATQEHAGFTVGVGFDLSVFSTIFGTKGTASGGMP